MWLCIINLLRIYNLSYHKSKILKYSIIYSWEVFVIASNQQFQIELRIDSGVPCLLFPFPPRSEKSKAQKQAVDIMVQYENIINQKGLMKEETGTRVGPVFFTSITISSKGRFLNLIWISPVNCVVINCYRNIDSGYNFSKSPPPLSVDYNYNFCSR